MLDLLETLDTPRLSDPSPGSCQLRFSSLEKDPQSAVLSVCVTLFQHFLGLSHMFLNVAPLPLWVSHLVRQTLSLSAQEIYNFHKRPPLELDDSQEVFKPREIILNESLVIFLYL